MPGTPDTTDTWEHTSTGHPAIDSLGYRRKPAIRVARHDLSGLLLFRMHDFGPTGTMATAVSDGSAPDMLFVSRGAGVAGHGHVARRRFRIRPTKAVRTTFVPHGVDGRTTFGSSAHSINLFFPQGMLARHLADVRHSGLLPLLFHDDERLVRIVRLLDAEINQPGFASELMVEGLVRALATLLTRVDAARLDAEADRIYLPAWKLRRVIDFVEANLAGPIGLSDLAAVAGLSPFHFSRVFKQATGTTPYHYVLERRLERARTLLATSSTGLAELALACGFSNQSHFTAAFTRAMGMAPGRYRATTRR